MKATVTWSSEVCFKGETPSGHQVIMDGPADLGGNNQGARPMEMLLLGVGGCASFDVVTILKKSRQQVSDCQCQISAQRADAVPAVFTEINLHFVVSGEQLKEAMVKRAVELSAEKYCSASIMMKNAGVRVTHSFEMRQA